MHTHRITSVTKRLLILLLLLPALLLSSFAVLTETTALAADVPETQTDAEAAEDPVQTDPEESGAAVTADGSDADTAIKIVTTAESGTNGAASLRSSLTAEKAAAPEPLTVTMTVPESVTVSADSPSVCLTLSFVCTGEDGPETGRLQVWQDGVQVRDLEIPLITYNGDINLTWEFTRYMTQTSGTVEYCLTYGDQTITAQTAVTLDNWPDEVYALKSGDALPYYIEVVKNHNVVLIYGKDDEGNYTQLVKTFLCSTGEWTPLGNFTATTRWEWRTLFANSAHTAYCYGQYAITISGNYLFHSVPYYTMNKGDLEYEEYNKLGTQASLGCIRLTVADVKWIYDNCPSGTPVSIVEREELGVEKPEAPYIDPESPNRGWDPTDPDPANPWNSTDSQAAAGQ